MRIAAVAVLAGLGMLVSAVGVWVVTPPGGHFRMSIGAEPSGSAPPVNTTPPSEFHIKDTLIADGRLGHTLLPSSTGGETYAYVELHADDVTAPPANAPLNLAIVIDRSGSMRGQRLKNALDAARGAIARLRDGDVLSIVTYNTSAEVVYPATSVTSAVRDGVARHLDTIVASGDTCISCGIETGAALLTQRSGMVSRLMLLSDGEATAGVKTVEGFQRIAANAGDRGISITSIGVDVDYNERVMSVLALESNGRHYFVENAASLPRIFDQEVESLTRTVVADAELVFTPAPGIEVSRVFDRAHRRDGQRVVLPLGTFARAEQKTFLASVRVPQSRDGQLPVGEVAIRYRDLTTGTRKESRGTLALAVSSAPGSTSPLDPLVALRLNRSNAREAVDEANRLFQVGRVEEARAKLRAQAEANRAAAPALANAPAAQRAKAEAEYQKQTEVLERADDGFEPAPVAAPSPAQAPAQERKGKAQVKTNADWSTSARY